MGDKRLTIKELHRQTGIAVLTLSKIYHGQTKYPDLKTVKTLCDYFDVTFDQFFGITEIKFKQIN